MASKSRQKVQSSRFIASKSRKIVTTFLQSTQFISSKRLFWGGDVGFILLDLSQEKVVKSCNARY